MMRALEASGGKVVLVERPLPVLGAGEVLVRAVTSALNRADCLQRRGAYPPPAGAPATLGLEVAGVVAALPPGATAGAPSPAGVPWPALGARQAPP